MPRIYYHPCPQALGEYNYHKDIIIIHEGLKKYHKLHDSILKHEKEHARIFKEHRSWLKRLVLNVKLDYSDRLHGTTKIPIEILEELNPSTVIDSAYQSLYILAYLPIYVVEGIFYTIKSIFQNK